MDVLFSEMCQSAVHCLCMYTYIRNVALILAYICAMYKLFHTHITVTEGIVVKYVEVTKKFRDFVIQNLRQKYSKVVMNLIQIFKKKKVNIEELITVLCFNDIDNKSVFSTDAAFSTIRTETQLFYQVGRYCRSIYDFQVLGFKPLDIQKQLKN